MSEAITRTEAPITRVEWTREQIDTIRKTVCRDRKGQTASDAQLALFLEVCRSRGLDPFTRQAHWTPSGVIVGIDGFRSIADRTGCYVPGPTRYECDADGRLVAAHVTVRILRAGQWHDLEESAWLAEYAGGTDTWRKFPRVMLAKCAEARALRRAFPSHLGGLYSAEEMDQATERDVTPPTRYEPRTIDARPALTEDQEERAAILEHDARVPRAEAEARAVAMHPAQHAQATPAPTVPVSVAPLTSGEEAAAEIMAAILASDSQRALSKLAARIKSEVPETLREPLRAAYLARRAEVGP